MAKEINRLSDRGIKSSKKPGWYPDGNGLYLQVSVTGTKSFVYRYKINGKERKRGLGAYPEHTLEMARNEADSCRRLRKKGIDPIERNKELELAKKVEKAKSKTFEECAMTYISLKRSGWKHDKEAGGKKIKAKDGEECLCKHEMYWRNTLKTYVYPVIGDLPVSVIDVDLVVKVLNPIWNTKNETADRVRQRIGKVLDYAKVMKYRTGDNPAEWKGNLSEVFTKPTDVQEVQHFKAMDFKDVPAYFRELRKVDTITAKALAFTILTASRHTEARCAVWNEINTKDAVWTLPSARMKAKKAHRVPLSDEALKILDEIKDYDSDVLFVGMKQGKPISEATVRKLLRKTRDGLTVHGFRSAFCDWCAEMTNYPRKVVEHALAHQLKDETEKAYQRSDLFDKRRLLMEAWSDYCLNGQASADIVPMRKKA